MCFPHRYAGSSTLVGTESASSPDASLAAAVANANGQHMEELDHTSDPTDAAAAVTPRHKEERDTGNWTASSLLMRSPVLDALLIQIR